jgi:hypothetical protein
MIIHCESGKGTAEWAPIGLPLGLRGPAIHMERKPDHIGDRKGSRGTYLRQ